MKRSGFLKRKTPLVTRAPLRRKTPLRPVNLERRARLRSEQFGPQADLCRVLPCCACGAPPPSDPAHVRSRGSGGKGARNLVPLCRQCHDEQGRLGRVAFELKHQVDLELVAKALEVQGGPRVAHPRVVNVRRKGAEWDVYVGRGRDPARGTLSEWGNPYPFKTHGPEAMRLYLDHLRDRIASGGLVLANLQRQLAGQVLACWCAPGPCHGEVLARLADGEDLAVIRNDMLRACGLEEAGPCPTS